MEIYHVLSYAFLYPLIMVKSNTAAVATSPWWFTDAMNLFVLSATVNLQIMQDSHGFLLGSFKYPLVNVYSSRTGNHHLENRRINYFYGPFSNSYVKLPEGIQQKMCDFCVFQSAPMIPGLLAGFSLRRSWSDQQQCCHLQRYPCACWWIGLGGDFRLGKQQCTADC